MRSDGAALTASRAATLQALFFWFALAAEQM
jgi:hypothetical protein